MKSKEEILGKYYSQSADGLPEISADGLLKAMEEYKDAAAEAAFNAARQVDGERARFAGYEDYKASLQQPEVDVDHVQLVADSIVSQFLPDDPNSLKFSLDVNTGGFSYTVHYVRTPEGFWQYVGNEQKQF